MKFLLVLAACALTVSAYEQIKVFKYSAEPRIIKGKEASDTDFPHHVALQITEDGIHTERCGGALLTESIVLTAAHCFDYFGKQGFASFGSNRYMNGTKIPFKRVIVHKDYLNTKLKVTDDIALIKLDEPVKVDGVKIKTIELNDNKIQENTTLTISGFGKISDRKLSDKLFYTTLTTITNEECKNILWPITIGEKLVCLKGNENSATCGGDSGGALVINWPENPTHVGIVSFGVAKCELGYPDVFTRTSDYIDWIRENVKLL